MDKYVVAAFGFGCYHLLERSTNSRSFRAAWLCLTSQPSMWESNLFLMCHSCPWLIASSFRSKSHPPFFLRNCCPSFPSLIIKKKKKPCRWSGNYPWSAPQTETFRVLEFKARGPGTILERQTLMQTGAWGNLDAAKHPASKRRTISQITRGQNKRGARPPSGRAALSGARLCALRAVRRAKINCACQIRNCDGLFSTGGCNNTGFK